MTIISGLKVIHLFSIVVLIAFALRFYLLGAVPEGFYSDEASIGFDAYSILKTGRDFHDKPMPLFFESFGEYKNPIYIYSTVPWVAIFGMNEFSTRFSAALFGVLTVIGLYFLVKKFSGNDFQALAASLFLAISPWHIQFSRISFEAITTPFFIIWGLYFFLSGLDKPKKRSNSKYSTRFLLSFLFFGLSIYSYGVAKLFTPLLLLGLCIIYRKQALLKSSNKQSIISSRYCAQQP